jgi:hypothetical protein
MMQRAERIFIVVIGTMIAAWFAAGDAMAYARAVLGWTQLLVGAAASATAVGRWAAGYRELVLKEAPPQKAAPVVPVIPVKSEARRIERPREQRIEENPMRITGEHTA